MIDERDSRKGAYSPIQQSGREGSAKTVGQLPTLPNCSTQTPVGTANEKFILIIIIIIIIIIIPMKSETPSWDAVWFSWLQLS